MEPNGLHLTLVGKIQVLDVSPRIACASTMNGDFPQHLQGDKKGSDNLSQLGEAG